MHPQRLPCTHALGHNSFTHRMLCRRRAGHAAVGLAASASGDILRNRLAAISQSQVSWKRKSQSLVLHQEGISHPEEERLA